jgi:hypothetical protein
MYNEEEYDRLLSVLRQLGINEHEMTQLLINESDSLQSISRASAAAAAAAATAAATGRISAQHDNNNNNDRNNCGNNGCGGRGSSYIHTMSSNNDNDNHQSYNNDRILDIGVGDGMLILPPPTNKSVVSYPNCDDDNNDRSDPPGENATTAYMEVECFVDTTTAKNIKKNMDNNNNNNKRLLPLSLSLKKNDNMTNNNPFNDDDDDDDDEVDNDDLGTVISCREIVPKQQSCPEKKKTMSSSPLIDNNPSKLIRGKSYIVNAETLDLVTLPTDESTKTTDNNMSLLNNKSNNNSANDVSTSDNLVVESTTAAIVKRKSLLSSIFSRKKSLKKESSYLESSASKQSSSSSHEWREFTDVTTGRKYYSNGILSSWENPALSTPMSNTMPQKIEKKETKKKRSRSTPPKSFTMTSKPTSSSHFAPSSSSSSSRPRRSKSSPPKQPSVSNAPAYGTTTTNNTIVETNDDDDDQTLISKLTFIPDGNVEINESYFSSIVKGYRLSTQSFHLPPPVQPPHPVSSPPIVYGVTTPPSSKIRSSSINNTVPLQKGCNMKNAAVNGAAANSSKRKKMTLQVQHQSKPTMTTDEVANYDQSSTRRPVIVGRRKSFESSDIVPSFHNSMKKAAMVDEQNTDIAVVAKQFSQCNKEAPVVTTETANVAVGRPMENSNIQYEHFQFVLTDSSSCDEHTRSAIERNNYNTNNMMIRLPYNPNTTFYDLRCELMEDYPNEIMQLLPNDFKFTISSSSSTNGLTISYIQEQKWKVREYYDLSTQSGNGSYKNPYQVFIKSNYINSSKANEIVKHDYDGCW